MFGWSLRWVLLEALRSERSVRRDTLDTQHRLRLRRTYVTCAEMLRILPGSGSVLPRAVAALRFFAWLALGLTIYIFYSRRHTEFAKKANAH